MQIDKNNVSEVFRYHAPGSEETVQRYVRIREGAKVAAEAILENVPKCSERTRALNMLIDAVAIANRAVALVEAGVDGV